MNDSNFKLLTDFATSAGTKNYMNAAVKKKESQRLTLGFSIICIFQVSELEHISATLVKKTIN
ncbi:MAG TPA: hypothetical protein VFS97_11820 [Nitrososphaeraceae archaeon]|nr:hypothetical protein [Nitrososphaeraceae archaeon]